MKLWIAMWGLLLSLTVQANDAAFKKTHQVFANMGPGCNVRIRMPTTAEFTVTYSKNAGEGGLGLKIENPFHLNSDNPNFQPFYLGFTCYAADKKRLSQGEPVRYNDQTKKWERDITNRFESWYSEEGKKELDRASHFYELNAMNANGYAYTEDDTIGDEQWRQRHLHYCVIKDAKALCGNGDMGYLRNGKKWDLTPYALQILRSIDFSDDAPPEQSAGVGQGK